ncbi:uncharacterized protein [Gorilla gorilla gorilla]|uniref:uncharacterized protein isoform X1 n=1 Tax=Gorilla gorilla gorilla TaxID=9595 RepID=UPI0024459CA7|nr:uncharacterized protein LOC115931713 isoform X1 [Gorilla gorilla gorilla]XP_055229552.1 uncharacterized protein LOC115931713 isoform X1 [Gorilla gorilla gorilla]XP_055229553.1 uncharacterized protein LOC115931713 isoform X1 [Gorilla gorilla gorilla]
MAVAPGWPKSPVQLRPPDSRRHHQPGAARLGSGTPEPLARGRAALPLYVQAPPVAALRCLPTSQSVPLSLAARPRVRPTRRQRPPSPARALDSPCGHPLADTPGLPQALELQSFQHLGPAQDGGVLRGVRAQGPGSWGTLRSSALPRKNYFGFLATPPARPPVALHTQSRQGCPGANSRPSPAGPFSHNAHTIVACSDEDPPWPMGQEGSALPRASTRAPAASSRERGADGHPDTPHHYYEQTHPDTHTDTHGCTRADTHTRTHTHHVRAHTHGHTHTTPGHTHMDTQRHRHRELEGRPPLILSYAQFLPPKKEVKSKRQK